MKKLFVSLLVIAAAMNVMAIDITAKAQLTLKGTTTNKTDELVLLQSTDLKDGLNTGYCALVPSLATKSVAFYAYFGGAEYGTFGTKDLGTLAFGLKTNDDTEYTLTAENVAGELYIYDEVAKQYFTLTEGAVYNFTATANETNLTRFHLAAAPAPAVPGICHQNGRLEFTAYEGASVQVVGYEDNTVVAVPATDITLAYQEIDLATLAAGQYLVIVTKADQTEEKLVIKK